MPPFQTFSYETALPCAALADFVSHFWCSRFHMGVQKDFSYYFTASTHTELAFAFSPKHKHRQQLVFAAVQGHTNEPGRIDSGDFSELFGVSLYSYAIPFFFGMAPSALAHQLVNLQALIGKDANTLTNRLAAGSNFQQRMAVITQYLTTRLHTNGHEDVAMLQAIKSIRSMRGLVNIRALASEFSLSQKQFERRFKNFSSFNPKLFARIIRFEAALGSYTETHPLTDLAYELDYYDQAHFINDFKQFTGFSPRKYRQVMPR
jgi:AraC-like DNA-binding protein